MMATTFAQANFMEQMHPSIKLPMCSTICLGLLGFTQNTASQTVQCKYKTIYYNNK